MMSAYFVMNQNVITNVVTACQTQHKLLEAFEKHVPMRVGAMFRTQDHE